MGKKKIRSRPESHKPGRELVVWTETMSANIPRVGELFEVIRTVHYARRKLPIGTMVMIFSVQDVFRKEMPEKSNKSFNKQKHTGKGKNTKRHLVSWSIGMLAGTEEVWKYQWGVRGWSQYFKKVAA